MKACRYIPDSSVCGSNSQRDCDCYTFKVTKEFLPLPATMHPRGFAFSWGMHVTASGCVTNDDMLRWVHSAISMTQCVCCPLCPWPGVFMAKCVCLCPWPTVSSALRVHDPLLCPQSNMVHRVCNPVSPWPDVSTAWSLHIFCPTNIACLRFCVTLDVCVGGGGQTWRIQKEKCLGLIWCVPKQSGANLAWGHFSVLHGPSQVHRCHFKLNW